MDGPLLQLGVGGIFAILVIREVLGFLGKGRSHGTAREAVTILRAVNSRVRDLHEWHDHEVQPGVKNWWVPSGMAMEMSKLREEITHLRSEFSLLRTEMEAMRKHHE